jgi:hypothetical protein
MKLTGVGSFVGLDSDSEDDSKQSAGTFPAGVVCEHLAEQRRILGNIEYRRALQERSLLVSGRNGYGVDYCYSPSAVAAAASLRPPRACEEIMASAERARVKDLFRSPAAASSDSDSDDATKVVTQKKVTKKVIAERLEEDVDTEEREALRGAPPPVANANAVQVLGSIVVTSQRGRCEALWRMKEGSLPDLIAMCQGLESLETDAMYPGLVFDLQDDERLKDFPNRALVMPKLHHLKEEAARRALLFDIKAIRKAARKDELIDWLKAHPIEDDVDTVFLRREANATYQHLLDFLASEASAQRAALAAKNWNHLNFLRLYHCAMDDDARPYMLNKDDCMTRLELDGRNSEERPPTWFMKIAELYNSNRVYVTAALPELDGVFTVPITLKFEEMAGGPITADIAKTRMDDARAKCIIIITNWENSGSGFGQHVGDAGFGITAEVLMNGDDRASFVQEAKGQRKHHLYLWHLAEEDNMLHRVLNILSAEVAVDADRVPVGLASTQRKRGSPKSDEGVEAKKQAFREQISVTLTSIGKGMMDGNMIQINANLESAIIALRTTIGEEEDRIERLTNTMVSLHPAKDALQISTYQRAIVRHESRLAEYQAVMADKLKPQRNMDIFVNGLQKKCLSEV